MRWDYRLVKMDKGHLEFREVFYESDKPKGSCEISTWFGDRYEAYAFIDRMADAMRKDILDEGDFRTKQVGKTFAD